MSAQSQTATEAAIRSLPKCELHLHLEGSMSPDVVASLHRRYGSGESLADVRQRFDFSGWEGFASLYLFGLEALTTGQALVDVVDALAEDLAAQSVRYAEITSTPWLHLRTMSALDYTQALDEGRRRASARGVEIGWILDIPRGFEQPGSAETTDFLAGAHVPEQVVAIGLGGDEATYANELYADDFARAAALGLRRVPHAGELAGPASVLSALDVLGADRIGHGVRSIEDERLIDRLVRSEVALEVCPTSNTKLGVVPSYEEHPLLRLIDAGVAVTLNSDDPGVFQTSLTDELLTCHRVLGLTLAQILDLQRTALRSSFAGESLRAAVLSEIDTFEPSAADAAPLANSDERNRP